MDELKLKRSQSEINIKSEHVIGRQRSLSESDAIGAGIQKQKKQTVELFVEENQEVQIDETAKVKPHRFASKEEMKGKKTVGKKKELIREDPFAMLANCSMDSSSSVMKPVRESLAKIDGLMDKEISVTEKDFKYEQTQLVAAYNEVITHCESYLQARRGYRWTINGKLRKLMVQQVKEKCEEELKEFEELSANIFREVQRGEKKQWIDVLGQIRTEAIDMDREDRQVKKGGAGTSEVFICNIDGETKYFKKSEKLDADFSPIKFAYREIENAKPGSIQEKIKNYLDENKDKGWTFEEYMETFANAEPDYSVFTMEINDENFHKLRKQFVESYLFDADILNAVCTDVESMKKFIELGKTVNKYRNMISIASETAQIKKNSVLSNHNVATSRVANLLGAPDLIATSKNVTLKYQGETIKGCLMDEAKGTPYGELKLDVKDANAKLRMSSHAIKQVYTLQLLDYLCGQIDRNQGNFLCVFDKTKDFWTVTGFTGIDNDMSFGELNLESLKGYNVSQLPPIINRQGVFGIPAIDEEVSARLMSLTTEELKFALKDLLGKNALNAAAQRLEQLKELVKDAVEKGDTVIISDENSSNLWEEAHQKSPCRYLDE